LELEFKEAAGSGVMAVTERTARVTIFHPIRPSNLPSIRKKNAEERWPLRFPVILALLCCATVASAQKPAMPARSSEQMQRDLAQIEREIGRANLECDYKYFDQVEAEEFLFTDATGGLTTKKQDMAGEKSCHKSSGSYEVDDTRVLIYGATAVVTGRVTTSATNKEGQKVIRHSRFTDVFVWRDGRWQLVAGHSSRIPEPKPQTSGN
jgi:ketosteroid isomerase-like protein